MTEVVAGPNAPSAVIAYLDSVLVEPVSGNVPSTRPAAFVQVVTAGGEGTVDKGVFRGRVALYCWAETPLKAYELAAKASGHLEASPVFYADCGAPVDFPDPRSSQPRCVVTVDLAISTVVL